MTTLIRVDDHRVAIDSYPFTGGNQMCLIKREKKNVPVVFDSMWYTEFENRKERERVTPRNLTFSRSYYGGTVPSYQNYANQHTFQVEGGSFPVGQWASPYKNSRWLKGMETRARTFDLIPIIAGNCSASIGEVFEASTKMRYQERSTNVTNGNTVRITDETLVTDLLGDGTNNRGFSVYENGHWSWANYNIWGNVTFDPRHYSAAMISFVAGSNDQAIAVNIFGNVTIKGSLDKFIKSDHAFSLIMVHDGATLTVTEGRGEGRGCAIAFGSGKIIGI